MSCKIVRQTSCDIDMVDTLRRVTEPERYDLSLRIEPAMIVLRRKEKLRVTARLTNNGTRPLTLVLPGDGSRMARRTPIVEWLFTPSGKLSGFEGCGNINELQSGDVFTLDPVNAFNHPQYNNPNTTIGNVNYGKVTSAHDPRTIFYGWPIVLNDNHANELSEC